MLIIYGALSLGGVETFFLRIAKQRYLSGKKTKILLYHPENNNSDLLNEVKKYAEVFNLSDVSDTPFLSKFFKLTSKYNKLKVEKLIDGVEQIHVFKGEDALIAYSFTSMLRVNIPISVGFYHYVYYLWGGKRVPYFERINRKFVLEFLPKQLLLLFSKDSQELYSKYTGYDYSQSNSFSIGVLDKEYSVEILTTKEKKIKICCVGRLVRFKTYNLSIISTVKMLIDKGYDVVLDIYGEGPLRVAMEDEIKRYNLFDSVKLKGALDYSLFDDVVSKYDIFVGTGTAIVQASALSIPSITALDNLIEARSYGFFSKVYDRQYGRNDLPIETVDFSTLIESYANSTLEEINILRLEHYNCVSRFYISSSVNSLESLCSIPMPKNKFKASLPLLIYDVSRLLHYTREKLDSKYRKYRQSLPYLD
ncbi:glycosyltransferase [Vibrio splendidus]|jgi:hypothetical protein|uniref:glycosyltransferase n=1 Tax=Vibrio splendidus TaxID=29497 RepID=UPI00352D2B0F